ncbi:MAG: LytTR family DNA-binding domain-containing protein [Verrucomicrobiaceae bacterium]|nr:LytTR family DNA-binding domain-containing protein [Verrucomicrobiaceae bacterium]
MKIRTIIVEDEPLARERLRGLLEADPEIEVIAECADGHEAVKQIREQRPDLIFLDVQLPELDGFGVLAALGGGPLPGVVFVTAYDKFALKAFEVHALDYLLKPFDRTRFQAALTRAREQLARRHSPEIGAGLQELLAQLRSETKAANRVPIKSAGRTTLMKPEEIDWIEAADNYVNVHTRAGHHLVRETMGSIEGRLPPEQFVRISRSCLVNINRVQDLQPGPSGTYRVTLRDGTRLSASRTHRANLARLLGKD